MKEFDLTGELWREYDFGGRKHVINNPVTLFISESGTTHRVFDGTIVHCVPSPGIGGCVLTWQPRDATKPVQF